MGGVTVGGAVGGLERLVLFLLSRYRGVQLGSNCTYKLAICAGREILAEFCDMNMEFPGQKLAD